MNSDSTLILFTSSFPFGNGETFLESELPFLAESFGRIFIVSNNLSAEQTRQIPPNAKVVRYPYTASSQSKMLALLNFLHLQNELKFMSRRGISRSKTNLSTLLTSYAKAHELNSFLENVVAENNIQLSQLSLYSYWMNDLAAGIAMFKHKNQQVKAFCRAHGWDVYFERHTPAYLPLRNFITSQLDAVYCISQNGKNYLDELTREQFSQKIKLARLGTFNKKNVLSKSNSQKLKLLSCSNIIPLKQIHLIVEALSLINNFEIDWIHFGMGAQKSEIEKLALEKLAGKKNILFEFGGQISNEALLNYYSSNAIDAFINVSETEGLPVSIMEANSFGIPAIATNVGGVSEIVRNDENGFLLGANCAASEIAEAIKKFYALSLEEKSAMRKNAFEIWNKSFNAEINYPAFIQSISSL